MCRVRFCDPNRIDGKDAVREIADKEQKITSTGDDFLPDDDKLLFARALPSYASEFIYWVLIEM